MKRLPSLSSRKYAVVGFAVSKFAMPVAKRMLRRKVVKGAKKTTKASVDAAKSHPGRTSVAVGSVLGAVGYLVSRGRNGDDDSDSTTSDE